MAMCILIVGNIVDGIRFIGPFNNGEEANEWADDRLKNEEWICAPLEAQDA